MPMNFPDMDSLERAAGNWKFREIEPEETEDDYRNALADFVQDKDFVEAGEIRHKVGWDQWTDEQQRDMLKRKGFPIK